MYTVHGAFCDMLFIDLMREDKSDQHFSTFPLYNLF